MSRMLAQVSSLHSAIRPPAKPAKPAKPRNRSATVCLTHFRKTPAFESYGTIEMGGAKGNDSVQTGKSQRTCTANAEFSAVTGKTQPERGKTSVALLRPKSIFGPAPCNSHVRKLRNTTSPRTFPSSFQAVPSEVGRAASIRSQAACRCPCRAGL